MRPLSWKRTTCACGGPHAWRHAGAAELQAPVATCAFGTASLFLFWPALLLTPLVYVSTHLVARANDDRTCDKCGMVINHKARARKKTATTRTSPPAAI